jgi:hypothetical protein
MLIISQLSIGMPIAKSFFSIPWDTGCIISHGRKEDSHDKIIRNISMFWSIFFLVTCTD